MKITLPLQVFAISICLTVGPTTLARGEQESPDVVCTYDSLEQRTRCEKKIEAQTESTDQGTIRCSGTLEFCNQTLGRGSGNTNGQNGSQQADNPSAPGKPKLKFDENDFDFNRASLNQDVLNEHTSSSFFRGCQELIPDGKTWIDVLDGKGMSAKDVWGPAWQNFRREQARRLVAYKEKSPEKLESFYDQFNEKIGQLHDKLAHCEAMRSITAYSSVDKESLKSGDDATQKSVDGKVVCKSAGLETQDYKTCINALDAYNAALVGTAVFTQAQTVKYQGDSMETASGLNPNDPTAGLKAQKDDIEGRANMTQQRAGLDVAKATGLGILLLRMPTQGKIQDHCASSSSISYDPIKTEFKNTVDFFYDIMLVTSDNRTVTVLMNEGGGPNNNNPRQLNGITQMIQDYKHKIDRRPFTGGNGMARKFCDGARKKARNLIVNTPAKDAIKMAAIAAGVDSVKHKLTADQLDKQANQVGKVIDDVNEFNPSDLPQFQGQDFQGSECDFDASAEGCDDFVDERSFGFQDRGPLQIHGMENASNFRRGETPDSVNPKDSAAGSSPDRSGAPKPIGIFDDKIAKKSGFDGRMPGAADVSRDGPAAANGSGGPSEAPGGGSPPPSQVPQQKQGNDGPRMSGAGNSRASYGGGGGSLSRSGGRGAMGRGSRDNDESGNPFSELFGNEDPSGNNTLNFRETASADNQINTPDTSIFEIISDRYVNVQKEDRLLEYKSQDPEELQ